jgi:hypothetical protein
MRILSFGDSYTYGTGMEDCNSNRNPAPSLFAYPQLLANSFKCSTLNLGSPGSSNKQIWNTILQSKINKGDIVTIMWSSAQRTCIINTPQEDPSTTDKWRIAEHVSGRFYTEHTTAVASWLDNDISKAYFEHVYDPIDADIIMNLFISHADFYLKSIGVIQVIHAVIPDTIMIKPFWNNNIKLLTWKPTDRTPDGHAGIQSHKAFTKILARQITNNT